MKIDGSIVKLRRDLNQTTMGLPFEKMYTSKGHYVTLPFKRNDAYLLTKEPLESNYKLAIKVCVNQDLLNNSFVKDFLLVGCDVSNVEDYRNWIYVWRYVYHELTMHIRDVKKLRSVKYAGKTAIVNKVLKDAGFKYKYIPDFTFPRMKEEAANYATLMIISRARMKAAFKQAHPENKKEQVASVELEAA